MKHKVFAYITSGTRLLVFRHPRYPEAGIQVPAGTLEEGEQPEDGVLREASEETGLSGLRIEAFLGEQERNWAQAERRGTRAATFKRDRVLDTRGYPCASCGI